jgi:two-component system CheB/CheR fusion protein
MQQEPVRDQGEPHCAERGSERRFRALVENAFDGVTLIGADGTMLETTPITFRGLGYTAEEYVGRNGFELLHPDDVALVSGLMARLLAQPGGKVTARYRLRHKDGSWRWVDAVATNLLGEPDVAAIVVNHRDVTEQQRLEDELRRRADELARADRHKDEFLATLAHELRSPLAPIRSATQVLKGIEPAPAELTSARDIIERQVAHLSRLVDDLLDISRVRQGKISLHHETVDAATVVARAVEIARPLLDARRHELSVALPPGPVWMIGDPTRLAQVLGNLLANAAKYMDEGGQVWLSAGEEGGEVVFRVRDRGMGIPAEMLTQVFAPFTQLERSLDRAEGGLGIGLALVRALVELHRGSVVARSEGPGRGSEFEVRLPGSSAVPRGEERSASEDSRPSGKVSRRVLVVDDNVDAAQSLALFLHASGHVVHKAHDGPAALEAALDLRPEVVLLDLGLPRMDGYEVARHLRARQPDGLVLIALTGHGQEEDRRRTREAGFDHHVVKPAAPETLLRLIGSG